MVDFRKNLDDFRKKFLENPIFGFWIIFGGFIIIIYIRTLRVQMLSLISSDILYLFLDFIILMVIYALYAFYFIPFVLHLPDGKQNFSGFLKTLKLTKSGLSLRIIFLGLLMGFCVLISFFFSDIILGDLLPFTIDFNQIIGVPNLMNLGYFNFIHHIVPALWEEIIFRGIILTLLLKIYPVRSAIIIDGVVFGIVHLANNASLFITLGQVIYTSCFGITLAYLYVKTSSLIPCIIAHYVNNILSALLYISNTEVNILIYFFHIGLISLVAMILRVGFIKLHERMGMVKERNKDSTH